MSEPFKPTHTPGWIGVDLDGTLAVYDVWRGMSHIGDPIRPMVARIIAWRSAGWEVRIFTARMAASIEDRAEFEKALAAWTLRHIGTALVATNVKDFHMMELWDDRAVQVIENTGHAPVGSQRGLGA